MIKNRKSEIGIERKFRLHMKPFCYRSEQITLLCCNNMLPRNIKFLWIPFADDHRSDKGIIVINTYWKRSCPVGREIKLLIRIRIACPVNHGSKPMLSVQLCQKAVI